MSDWTQLIETGFQKLSELAGKYGPPAIDTAAQVVRVDAIGSLVTHSVALAAPILAMRYVPRLYRFAKDDCSNAAEAAWFGVVALFVAGCVGALYALAGLLNAWNWMGALNPKLALAAKIVHAIPGLGQ